MIRYALAEAWALARHRVVVSLVLSVTIAIPVALAGYGVVVGSWLQPLVDLEDDVVTVPVLLHPRMDGEQRSAWVADQRTLHPAWEVTEISPDELRDRLVRWFPYLSGLFRDEEPVDLPVLVEVSAPQPEEVRDLLVGPAVIAVGPTSSVNRMLGAGARLAVLGISALSALLLLSGIVLAATWVHLEIYRHAEEISVMRLVGATEGTIRSPFLVLMGGVGLVAGVLAGIGTRALTGVTSRALGGLGLPAVVTSAPITTAQVVVCVTVPVLAAAVTLLIHARRTTKGAP